MLTVFVWSFGWIAGKVVKPDDSPEKFMTFIGELDKRVKLDSNIRKGDGRYNPSLSMMAAKLCYENEDFVKVTVQDHLKVSINLIFASLPPDSIFLFLVSPYDFLN